MTQSTSLSSHPVRLLLWVLLLLGSTLPAAATHIRAGDIQAVADRNNLLRYTFTLRLYTDDASQIDQNTIDICFGDGTSENFRRKTKTELNTCTNVSENVYEFEHVFPGPSRYTISCLGNNRNGSILNLGSNPTDLGIYIATTILIDATTGINNSPVFKVPPIDQGAVGQVFTHAPGATDTDRTPDSLSFAFLNPRQGRLGGRICDPPVDITTFISPGDSRFTSGPQVFNINPRTGLITWNFPNRPGEFNLAYIVKEWRSLGGGRVREVSSVVRDMQITITPSQNRPPDLTLPRDTCVIANQTLRVDFSATDPDNQPVQITAVGGPFIAIPGAQLATVNTNPRTLRFTWTPACEQVARQQYLTTITAKDVVPNCETSLTKLGVWSVRVVGPKPRGLLATVETPFRIRLQWSAYECRSAADSLRIYRKIDSTDFEPDVCQTGIPPQLGYRYVGSVGAGDTTFLDTNGGKRFRRGTTYCYRIYATWPRPGRGESLASDEACTTVEGLLPQLINADVNTTDPTTGQVTVRWTQGNPGALPAIYTSYYRLQRSTDTLPDSYSLVRDRIGLSDTTLVDTGLDTRKRRYRYRLEFISENINNPLETLADTVKPATTAFLSGVIQPTNTVDLQWRYEVPWDNKPRYHYIYRRINGAFVRIDSVQVTSDTLGTYTDRFTFGGIAFAGKQFEYLVLTRGTYRILTRQTDTTANFTQIAVVSRLPCPPLLALAAPDCAAEAQSCPTELFNQLRWTPDRSPSCSQDIKEYHVYFRPTNEGPFTLLATTTDTTYRHAPLSTRLGCYAVTAVDSSDNESPQSNIVCQDNCQYFTLPNIITPQNDGLNDVFRPICSAPVKQVKFMVFNRWGRKVYEGDQDPRINWPGTTTSGDKLTDGAYFYRAEVQFDTLVPVTQAFKGWVQLTATRDNNGGGGR